MIRAYWVIDALDECSAAEKRNYDNLFSMLSKIEESTPLKIFVTSRFSADLERLFAPLPVVHGQITMEDTQHDIRMYVETHSEDLPEETRETLVQRIVEKSSGCFLWTVLVMQQLQDVYSLEETERVLDEIPEEMEPLYERNIGIMSNNNRTKRLAMTILRWVVCAMRPLTVDELKEAIKLDINDTVTRDLEKSISSLCGQLVYVDRHSRVLIVHETARAFLIQSELSLDFRIDAPAVHLQLGLVCLKYLSGDEMAYKKKRKSIPTLGSEPKRNALAEYTWTSFSEHVSRASSSSKSLHDQLIQFLRTNVLSWIERAAELQDLSLLVQTGKHLQSYVLRRAKHAPLLHDDIKMWATDLARITAAFGANLLSTPSAIHALVPPFCPRNSIISRLAHSNSGGFSQNFSVRGLSYPDWHDRISCIYHRESNPKSIACGDNRFAIGLSNGMIHVYRTSICEQILHIRHGEAVRILQFGSVTRVLASAGIRSIKLWDVTVGSCLLDLSMVTIPTALAFDDNDKLLIAATKSKEIITWRTEDAVTVTHYVWEDRLVGRTPTEVVISPEHNLVAIVYRCLPIMFWCLATQRLLGTCSRLSDKSVDNSHGILSIALNPNPELELLAVAYWDGEITLYDTARRQRIHSVLSEVQTLAASPDGRTLAAGDSAGDVLLYDFGTLQLLYHVILSGDSVVALTFTNDSLRFLDIRGSQVNVWEPSALVRKDVDDATSEPSDAITAGVLESSATPYEAMATINTFICCAGGTAAICGRNNGVVDVHDLTNPDNKPQVLYRHKGSFTEILLLDWNESEQVLVSVDNASHFRVVRLSYSPEHSWKMQDQIVGGQLESECPINQALLNSDATKLLLSTSKDDFIWSLTSKEHIAFRRPERKQAWKWYTDPQNPGQVILLQGTAVQTHRWQDLEEVAGPAYLDTKVDQGIDLVLEDIHIDQASHDIFFKYARDRTKSAAPTATTSMQPAATHVAVLPIAALRKMPPEQNVHSKLILPFHKIHDRPEVDTIIGSTTENNGLHSLLFLTESGWICSITLDDEEGPCNEFRRHFFVPLTWLSASTSMLVQVSERWDIVVVRGEELAVIRNGLENVDVVRFE